MQGQKAIYEARLKVLNGTWAGVAEVDVWGCAISCGRAMDWHLPYVSALALWLSNGLSCQRDLSHLLLLLHSLS